MHTKREDSCRGFEKKKLKRHLVEDRVSIATEKERSWDYGMMTESERV